MAKDISTKLTAIKSLSSPSFSEEISIVKVSRASFERLINASDISFSKPSILLKSDSLAPAIRSKDEYPSLTKTLARSSSTSK